MKELTQNQIMEVSGGFKLNIGQAVGALICGAIAGGPVGFGYALGTIIIAQAVNSLDEMRQNEFGHH